jgi:hypothetical protein
MRSPGLLCALLTIPPYCPLKIRRSNIFGQSLNNRFGPRDIAGRPKTLHGGLILVDR